MENLNKIPKEIKKVFFLAICGTAMSALASMLKDMGFEVFGSDTNVYPPISTFLKEKDIVILDGYKAENIKNIKPDLCIIGNAISKNNEEVIEIINQKISYCSMPQAINHFLIQDKKAIVVAGTHGKTTTSSLVAHILEEANKKPSFLIGGILKNFNSNYKLENGNFVVLEGDEYDTAFFDKGSKFLHYPPSYAILTSIEFDHGDIFKNLDEVKNTFQKFVQKINKNNILIAFDNDKNIDEVIQNSQCKILRYGEKESSNWKIKNLKVQDSNSYFEVFKEDNFFGSFKSFLTGKHNIFNLLSVLCLCDNLKISKEDIQKGIESFLGVKRRQEIRGIKNGIRVIDDFAHHPSAVKLTINGIKNAYAKDRIIAVFEPRTNTSIRNFFQDDYAKSFDDADIIILKESDKAKKIKEEERFSILKLEADLQKQGKFVRSFFETSNILNYLKEILKEGDTVLIMSNGGFDNIHQKLLNSL